MFDILCLCEILMPWYWHCSWIFKFLNGLMPFYAFPGRFNNAFAYHYRLFSHIITACRLSLPVLVAWPYACILGWLACMSHKYYTHLTLKKTGEGWTICSFLNFVHRSFSTWWCLSLFHISPSILSFCSLHYLLAGLLPLLHLSCLKSSSSKFWAF